METQTGVKKSVSILPHILLFSRWRSCAGVGLIVISFTMGSASSTHGHEWFCAFGTSARLGEFLAIRGDKN
ncbi:hypothetical protein [Algoriphagus marinus]|uniref:hypothetical protein n=1 Tax=Algoriphagus marinus TaxID=1925762 RepID=UPI000A63741A|nr:hypothetical protein [Algoriphagus marinus]